MPEPRPVSFPTSDGGRIHADLYGRGPRGVVLAHGGRFDKASWRKQADALVAAGFRVLAFDFRGKGQSRAGNHPGSRDDGLHLDVLAAIRYLRERGAKTVSVVGASFGGWAAARASTEVKPDELDALVLLAASGVDQPERLQGRKLFVVAHDDANDAGPRLPEIRAKYERAPQPKELLILEGDAHAQFIFESDEGEVLLRAILRFLGAKEDGRASSKPARPRGP